MRRIKLSSLSLAVLIIQGCANTTNETLESEGGEVNTVVNADLKLVFERIIDKTRPCVARGGLSVESDFLETLGKARVSAVYQLGSPGNKSISTARLRRVTNKQTEVVVNYYLPPVGADGWKWLGDATIDWAQGAPGQCKWDARR